MKYNTTKVATQLKSALDGRSQRWLGIECKISEFDVSKKFSGKMDWKEDEIKRIEKRLKFEFKGIMNK